MVFSCCSSATNPIFKYALNSGETQTESKLLNSDNFEIEEVLEDSSQTESE